MKLCTWCVADLGHPGSCLQIEFPAEMRDQPYQPGHPEYDLQYARSPRKIELIGKALEDGRRVTLNCGFVIEPPVATWHGDPACAAHLAEQVQLERDGRYVRMAQWRR